MPRTCLRPIIYLGSPRNVFIFISFKIRNTTYKCMCCAIVTLRSILSGFMSVHPRMEFSVSFLMEEMPYKGKNSWSPGMSWCRHALSFFSLPGGGYTCQWDRGEEESTSKVVCSSHNPLSTSPTFSVKILGTYAHTYIWHVLQATGARSQTHWLTIWGPAPLTTMDPAQFFACLKELGYLS